MPTKSLWTNHIFIRLFAITAIGTFGSWLDIFAFQVILVHQWHASALMLSLLDVCYILPKTILSPFAGVVADRINRKYLLLSSYGLMAMINLFLFTNAGVVLTLLLIFVRTAVKSVNVPSEDGCLKSNVAQRHLLTASSYFMAMASLNKIMGPLLGAGLLLVASPWDCVLINAISLIIATLIIATLPASRTQPSADTQQTPDSSDSWLTSFKNGVQLLTQNRFLSVTILLLAMFILVMAGMNAQIAYYLGYALPDTTNALGFFLSISGTGMLLGLSITKRYYNKLATHYFAFIGFTLLAATVGILASLPPHSPQTWVYIPAFTFGLSEGILGILLSYIIIHHTPQAYMGRISGIQQFAASSAALTGVLAAGIIATGLGITVLYFMSAGALFAVGVISLFVLNIPQTADNESH